MTRPGVNRSTAFRLVVIAIAIMVLQFAASLQTAYAQKGGGGSR